MNSFQDLKKSDILEHQIIYQFIVTLFDTLFQKHDNIIIDAKCENDDNLKFIQNNSKFLEFYFDVPKRILTSATQKSIRQTIKHLVEHLNAQFKFQNPIKFHLKKIYSRVNGKVVGSSHTILTLI